MEKGKESFAGDYYFIWILLIDLAYELDRSVIGEKDYYVNQRIILLLNHSMKFLQTKFHRSFSFSMHLNFFLNLQPNPYLLTLNG